MAKGNKTELNIYWDDGITIETRYYPSERMARKYIKDNGITNYRLVVMRDKPSTKVNGLHYCAVTY